MFFFSDMVGNFFNLLLIIGALSLFSFMLGRMLIIPLVVLSVDITVFPGKDISIILAGFGYYSYPIFSLITPAYKNQ